jgi:hypothetical protein
MTLFFAFQTSLQAESSTSKKMSHCTEEAALTVTKVHRLVVFVVKVRVEVKNIS